LARLAAGISSKPTTRDLGGHVDLPFLQRAHGAHGDQVRSARGWHRSPPPRRQQFVGGLKTGLLGADRVDLRAGSTRRPMAVIASA